MVKSFILYQEYKKNLSTLSQEQKGDLLDAIFAFNEGEEIEMDPIVNMAFSFIKSDLERNKEKYENIVKRNKINGLRGGRPTKPKKPSGLSGNPKNPRKPKKTLNDNDNVNVNDIDNNIKNNKFYYSELKKSTDPDYERFVKILFGDNDTKSKFNGILSIRDQLTFDQFEKIKDKKLKDVYFSDILPKMENDKKYWKNKVSLYQTLLNWATRKFEK